jgi:DNA-binding CsgD family transcriptional regulator
MHAEEPRESAVAGTPLLDREREFEALSDALARGGSGDARVVVVEGDPGLGKTSLVDWIAAQAREREYAVLQARGGTLERTLGWGVARQLFEELVARAPASTRRSLLRGSAALAAPVLGLSGNGTSDPSPLKDFRFEHGLYWLVCNLTERSPLALLIDDVQWCDEATLEWMLYLARRCERLPLLVVLATRSGEPQTPSTLLDLIAAEPVTTTLPLAALSQAATETLLERAYGSEVGDGFGQACHEWTGGNPLFVTELAAELAAEGVEPVDSSAARVQTLTPEGVARVIMLRLARLSEPSLDLARAVAVLESAAELRFASELAGLEADNAVAALDELVVARVLTAERPLRFIHPVIRSVVYDDVPGGRRAMMHKRAARLLLDGGADPGRVAAHLLRSTPAGEQWVVTELQRAAEAELSRGSPSTAVQLLRRAQVEAPPAAATDSVLLELGRSELLSGDPAGVQTLRSALAASTDVLERGQIAMLLARLLLGGGDGSGAVAAAGAAADEVGWQDHDLRLQLEALIVNAARSDAGLVHLIAKHLRIAREHADDDSYGSRLIAAQLSWGLTAIGAPAERAVELARRALAGGRLIREAPNAPDAYLGAIHMLAFADELSEADNLFAQAIALAQQNGSLPAFSAASCFRAHTAYLRGNLEQAELLARDALRVSNDSGALTLIDGLASAFLALVLVARGAYEDAGPLLADEPAVVERSSTTWATETMFVAGCAALAQGRHDRAAAWLLGCGQRAISWGVVNPAWLPWRSQAAVALHQLGDPDEALRLSDEELSLARRCGSRRPIGIALRARGLIDTGPVGIDLLRESADVLADSPARLEHARTLVALGGALRRANHRAEARTALTEGLTLAEHCGAVPLADEARSGLLATGARPRSVIRSGTEALTSSERRVCELAASGKSNPEIAQLLFVTRATVESHLHSAYRRLDIGSRKELAEALSAPGP